MAKEDDGVKKGLQERAVGSLEAKLAKVHRDSRGRK